MFKKTTVPILKHALSTHDYRWIANIRRPPPSCQPDFLFFSLGPDRSTVEAKPWDLLCWQGRPTITTHVMCWLVSMCVNVDHVGLSTCIAPPPSLEKKTKKKLRSMELIVCLCSLWCGVFFSTKLNKWRTLCCMFPRVPFDDLQQIGTALCGSFSLNAFCLASLSTLFIYPLPHSTSPILSWWHCRPKVHSLTTGSTMVSSGFSIYYAFHHVF